MRGQERDPARRQATVTAFADEVSAGVEAAAPTKPGLLAGLRRAIQRRGRE